MTGQVAVVAGGSGALGRQVVSGLIEEGHRVLVLDRIPPDRDCASQAFARVDLTEEDQIVRALEEWTQRWDVPRVLVNCQGWSPKRPDGRTPSDVEMPSAEFLDVIKANLLSCYLTMRAVVPQMASAGGGRVVNVSSTSALTGRTTASSAYAASKAGVDALTRSFAARYGPQGVLSSVVSPGKFVNPHWPDNPEALTEYVSEIPLGRLAEAAEIAQVILFLASTQNRYVNGHTIVVDGGRLA